MNDLDTAITEAMSRLARNAPSPGHMPLPKRPRPSIPRRRPSLAVALGVAGVAALGAIVVMRHDPPQQVPMADSPSKPAPGEASDVIAYIPHELPAGLTAERLSRTGSLEDALVRQVWVDSAETAAAIPRQIDVVDVRERSACDPRGDLTVQHGRSLCLMFGSTVVELTSSLDVTSDELSAFAQSLELADPGDGNGMPTVAIRSDAQPSPWRLAVDVDALRGSGAQNSEYVLTSSPGADYTYYVTTWSGVSDGADMAMTPETPSGPGPLIAGRPSRYYEPNAAGIMMLTWSPEPGISINVRAIGTSLDTVTAFAEQLVPATQAELDAFSPSPSSATATTMIGGTAAAADSVTTTIAAAATSVAVTTTIGAAAASDAVTTQIGSDAVTTTYAQSSGG